MDTYTKKCVERCSKLSYTNYEIIVLPDEADELSGEKVKVIPTGAVKPLKKRFIGSVASDGEICAFIDSDAYPDPGWLKNAVPHFVNPEVAAVAGPSLTDEKSSVMEKASSLILASSLGAGAASIRYRPHERLVYITETPTCNLVIRKSVLGAVEKLAPDVWPGEEIVFCGLITHKLGMKILYDPRVLVYHRRRPLYRPHLKQIWSYGLVKGHLSKSYPKFVRLQFFMPALLIVGVVGGFPLALVNPVIRLLYVLSILAYVLLSLSSGISAGLKERNVKMVLHVFLGTMATHLCYGLSFIRGFFSKKV